MSTPNEFHVTGLAKVGGPLTKRISLTPDGKLASDGSACVMTNGWAKRVPCTSLARFADLISDLDSNEAIALGTLRRDLPETVQVTTKDKLEDDRQQHDIIARISEFIAYEPGVPALALIDIDTKGMPPSVRNNIDDLGGYLPALRSVMPELGNTARVIRRSTSTGVSRTDTGEALPGSSGLHIFLLVQDGADVERFLRTFHDRCWLHGLGWHMVGAGGQLLDRSLVDKMVYAPERLVFEGAPQLVPPLVQDKESRRPVVYDGTTLDTRDKCPALSLVEKSKLDEIKARSGHSLKPERAKVRDAFIDDHADKLVRRSGGLLGMPAARRIIQRQCEGVLLPSVVLPWDNKAFDGYTVLDVLRDPARFVGATMADPLEGPEYGRGKAKVMRRADGSPWIHSFAHGRTVYELKYDAKSAGEIIDSTPPDQVADAFVQIVVIADLEPDEVETLRNKVAAAAGVTKRSLDRKLKEARQGHTSKRRAEERERKAAERTDHRPQIAAPESDAPWLPQMEVLNDVLGNVKAPEPPMRDIEGFVTSVRVKRVPGMHLLTSDTANGAPGETDAAGEQPLLHRMDEPAVAELIETHIDYVNPDGMSVHLHPAFVKHFHQRSDAALPTVVSVATLPVVLQNGEILSRNGLNRRSGTVFRIPPDILAYVPTPSECTADRAKNALNFLVNEWLVDVLTDNTGRCALVSAAATLIQRIILAARPAFMLSAPKRGGGKTTTLQMLGLAVTGYEPSAASWSENAEERRKALMSYFVSGVPLIIWDNIELGTEIACPHIEKSITSPTVSDRILGVTRQEEVPSTAIHMFTGNNILPVRDMASRTLHVRLTVDRSDPENRPFRHRDPIAWTRQNRGKILRALYTIMLAQPTVGNDNGPVGRFKEWWHVVGRPIENAARDLGIQLDFGQMFLQNEVEDETVINLVDTLDAMATEWPDTFKTSDIAALLNDDSNQKSNQAKERAATLRDFLFPEAPGGREVSAKSIGRLLRRYVGTPVARQDGATLSLKTSSDRNGISIYHVERRAGFGEGIDSKPRSQAA
jgi:hypothetical protein